MLSVSDPVQWIYIDGVGLRHRMQQAEDTTDFVTRCGQVIPEIENTGDRRKVYTHSLTCLTCLAAS